MEVNDIDDLIKNEQSEVKIYISLTLVIFFLGIFLAYFGSDNPNIKTLAQLGGGFITAISGVPISRVLFIRKRIFAFKMARKKIASGIEDEDVKKLKESLLKNIISIIESNNTIFNFGAKS